MIQFDPASIPPPTATGFLSEKPLAQLLAFALERRLSGTFELADDPTQYALVAVSQGLIAGVWTSEPVSYLGQLLYEAGAITDVQLRASLAELAASKTLQGQIFLAHGIITPDRLGAALRQQRLRKVHHIFTFPATSRFNFYADIDLVGARPNDVEPADPLPSIWRGLAALPPWDHVQAASAALSGRALYLRGALDTQAFRESERAALEWIRQRPATLAELTSRLGFDPQTAELLAYFLMLNRLVEITAPMPSTPSFAPAPGDVPPGRSGTTQVRKIAVADGTGEGPPSIGGSVPPSSIRVSAPPPSFRPSVGPPSSVRAPPISVRPGTPHSIRPLDPPMRQTDAAPVSVRPVPIAPTSRPAVAPEPAEPNPAADQLIAQAEMHFVLDERHQALAFVRDALTLVPKMPAAMALMAALEATNVHKGQEDKLRAIIKRLDAIVAADQKCRRGHFYRGRLKKRVGDLDGALDDLEIAAAADPDDADVTRELKIIKATKEMKNEPRKTNSFLDMLRRR